MWSIFSSVYYMVNYSVSLAAFEFTINGTEKCITAYARLSSLFIRERANRTARGCSQCDENGMGKTRKFTM